MRSIEVSRDRLRGPLSSVAADELALRRNAGFECDPSQHNPARPRGSTAGPSSATMNGTFCVISPRNTCAASPRAARRTPCRSRPRQIRPCERALADGKLLVRRALRLLNRGWLQSAYRCEFDGKDRCEGQKGHTKLVVGRGSFSTDSAGVGCRSMSALRRKRPALLRGNEMMRRAKNGSRDFTSSNRKLPEDCFLFQPDGSNQPEINNGGPTLPRPQFGSGPREEPCDQEARCWRGSRPGPCPASSRASRGD